MKTLLTALALSLFAALSAGCVAPDVDSEESDDVDVEEAALLDKDMITPMMGGVVAERPAVGAGCGRHWICTIDFDGHTTCHLTPYHCD